MSVYVLEGLRPWVIQRVSGVYIALFTVYLLYSSISAEQIGFDLWRAWLFDPVNSVGVGLLIISVLFHAWIGIRDVILDYIHNIMLRIFILALVMGVLAGSGLWAFRILLLSVVN